MRNGLRILAIVPARGGSKGVHRKNLHPLAGRPLVVHTAALVGGLSEVDRAVVSTDSAEIAATCQAAGLPAPFLRPESLAGDRIGDLEVLRHSLEEMERQDQTRYDYVLMLQPTCPLRNDKMVTDTYHKAMDEGWDAVWTVSPSDLKYHPLKALAVGPDGALGCFDARGAGIIARQQLVPVYHRNGAAYAISRAALLVHQTILPARTGAVVIEEPLVSIDTLEDFARVEALLLQRGLPLYGAPRGETRRSA